MLSRKEALIVENSFIFEDMLRVRNQWRNNWNDPLDRTSNLKV
jgi:hypothetical protein